MIRIKFEVEEQETGPLPIESKNVDSTSEDIVNKKPPENFVAAEVPVANSVAFGSKSIKTEPVESSLSLTTQLNNSLNIQSLLRQNRIQNGWTTNEQSIPIGTQQQQQQSLLLPKIEPIFSDNQEVPLSLDRGSLIPNGTQQQQQYLLLPKIEPIVSEIQQEVPLSLDQCSSISNSNSMETTTTTAANPISRRRENVPKLLPPFSADNLESTNNDIEQDSVSGSISGPGPSSSSSSSPSSVVVVAAPSRRQLWLASATPEQREQKILKNVEWVRRQREKESEVQRQLRLEQKRQYNRKRRQQLLANATPEQREQWRLKEREKNRRRKEKESEEQRQRRLEQKRQYDRTVRKQRREQKRQTMTPEEREKKRAIYREYYYRSRERKKNESLKESQIGGESLQTSMSSISSFISDLESNSNWTGGSEESNGQTITTLESPKPGPSMKLPRPRRRCQRNVKLKQYLELSTDNDDTDSD